MFDSVCAPAECLSEVGAYYGSDFPPTVHTNTSSAEECCLKCQASPDCNVWNWCRPRSPVTFQLQRKKRNILDKQSTPCQAPKALHIDSILALEASCYWLRFLGAYCRAGSPQVLSDVGCIMGRCGAAEGCLYPSNLADADGRIGVAFRTCDFKAAPITVSGTTALPPETTRTGDMAAWTSGKAFAHITQPARMRAARAGSVVLSPLPCDPLATIVNLTGLQQLGATLCNSSKQRFSLSLSSPTS